MSKRTDNSDVMTVRLGDFAPIVDRVCKLRGISRSEFMKSAMHEAARNAVMDDPTFQLLVLKMFIPEVMRIIGRARQKGFIKDSSERKVMDALRPLREEIETKQTEFEGEHRSAEADSKESTLPFPKSASKRLHKLQDRLLDDLLSGVERLAEFFGVGKS